MSGIPVGSPPVPPGRHAAPSGWYADPLDSAQERYWDGWQWSRNTREREGGAPAAATGAVGQPAPYPPSPPHPGQAPYGSSPQQAGQGQQGYPGPAGYPPQQGYPSQPGYPAYPGYPVGGPGGPGRPGQAGFTADGVRLAGWWWRVLATVIDNVVTALLATLASLPLLLPVLDRFSAYIAEVVEAAQQGLPQPVADPAELIPLADQLLLAVISVAITFVYHAAFLRWRGATPGKLLCGLRVVPVDQGRAGGRLSVRTVVLRAAVWAAPGLYSLLLVVQLVDVLFPLGQPRRQALHDLAAGTQVVRP